MHELCYNHAVLSSMLGGQRSWSGRNIMASLAPRQGR